MTENKAEEEYDRFTKDDIAWECIADDNRNFWTAHLYCSHDFDPIPKLIELWEGKWGMHYWCKNCGGIVLCEVECPYDVAHSGANRVRSYWS